MSFLAVWTGLEPATPCVTGRYSNQLNYQTNFPVFLSTLTTVSLCGNCCIPAVGTTKVN